MKLKREFYMQDTEIVARELIGKVLVHKLEETFIKGRIVETEAYLGLWDKAAHSYGGRRTERTRTMFAQGGIAYVYFIYGMYYCFNVVTREEEVPEAVLIRGIEPLEDSLEQMSLLRYKKTWKELTALQRKNLSNGPGKMAMAFGLDKSCNALDLLGEELYIEEGEVEGRILTSRRIGIDYAEEARDWALRFYLEGSCGVSPVKKRGF
ncbi:DNA-3-methyladenine glycosylase [Filifactor villosus]|uniref:Putative 3-methyladenine DNA glycosylase n=1 Tax=Filifactor villosus TaxID=29374 RepID=A0ABV9QPP3_9FIRM